MATLQIKKATKKTKKLRCLITGQTGAGKTFGALLLARGLCPDEKTLVFDTENGRSALKVGSEGLGDFEWDVIEVSPKDVTSDDYIQAIKLAEDNGYAVVILDSATHEWEFVKGVHAKLGGRFTDWGKAKEYHHRFIRAILGAKVHVILTARSSIKHEQQEINGKKQVVKLGLDTQQESNMAYEMDFVLDIIDRDHTCIIDKQEGNLFSSTPTITISEETGQRLATFLADGEDEEATKKKLFISRITELQEKILSTGKFSDEQLKKMFDKDLSSMSIEDLTITGQKYKEILENLGK